MSAEHQQVAQTTLHATVEGVALFGQAPGQIRLDHLFRANPGDDSGAKANDVLRQHIEQYRAQYRLADAQPGMAP
jgi:hypothetical protein